MDLGPTKILKKKIVLRMSTIVTSLNSSCLQNMTPECPICYETFQSEGNRRPKLLPCLHTYCYLCLRQLGQKNGQIKCPECRAWHGVPDEGIEAFPANMRILDNLRNLSLERNSIYTLPQSGQIFQIEYCEVHNVPFTQYSSNAAHGQMTCPLCLRQNEANSMHNLCQVMVQNEINSGGMQSGPGIFNARYVSGNSTRELVLNPSGLGSNRRGEHLGINDSTRINILQSRVLHENSTRRCSEMQQNHEGAVGGTNDNSPESCYKRPCWILIFLLFISFDVLPVILFFIFI